MQLEDLAQVISSFLPTWFDDQGVKCKGINAIMYPSHLASEVSKAKSVCNGLDGQPACRYRETCLRHAIDHHESAGVWGGTSERDRRKIWRARRKYGNRHIYSLEDVKFPMATVVHLKPVVYVKRRPPVLVVVRLRHAS